jgi:hypothetical protein
MEYKRYLYADLVHGLKGFDQGIDYDRMYSQIEARSKSSETLHTRLNCALAGAFMLFLVTFSVFAGHYFFYSNNSYLANYILKDSGDNGLLISNVFE